MISPPGWHLPQCASGSRLAAPPMSRRIKPSKVARPMLAEGGPVSFIICLPSPPWVRGVSSVAL
eukprot:327301-Pyramimonas_sp.AAC.1